MQKPTKEEAAQLIDQAISRQQLTRNDHVVLQKALQVLLQPDEPVCSDEKATKDQAKKKEGSDGQSV